MFYLGRCVWRVRLTPSFARLRHTCGNCMIYWHFIGVVWLILFAFLHD